MKKAANILFVALLISFSLGYAKSKDEHSYPKLAEESKKNGDLEKAKQYWLKQISWVEKNKKDVICPKIYIAEAYYNLGDYQKAYDYYINNFQEDEILGSKNWQRVMDIVFLLNPSGYENDERFKTAKRMRAICMEVTPVLKKNSDEAYNLYPDDRDFSVTEGIMNDIHISAYEYDKTIEYFESLNKTDIVNYLKWDKEIWMRFWNSELRKYVKRERDREFNNSLIAGLMTTLSTVVSYNQNKASGTINVPTFTPSPIATPSTLDETNFSSATSTGGQNSEVSPSKKIESNFIQEADISIRKYKPYTSVPIFSTKKEIVGTLTINLIDLGEHKYKLKWNIFNRSYCSMTLDFVLWYGDKVNNNPFPSVSFVPSYEVAKLKNKEFSLDFSMTDNDLDVGFTFTINGNLHDCK